ncbi:hypothetical protein [Bacillus sp. SM2101]|uniref:hypothetical protein n=1 Tax=Bacillus sp. SM2101 TaxID=2805366 RepID=UPI001BDE6388|nr:hypothetical protein [Bacillus sp. SM2101]
MIQTLFFGENVRENYPQQALTYLYAESFIACQLGSLLELCIIALYAIKRLITNGNVMNDNDLFSKNTDMIIGKTRRRLIHMSRSLM